MESIQIAHFQINDSLKNHYLFNYPIEQLIGTFILVYNREEEELCRISNNGLEKLYGEPSFSQTVHNISDIIVYKYLNDDLSFAQKAFVRCNKFQKYPFSNKIKEFEKTTDNHDARTSLYNIQYYNKKGTILKHTQIRGKNMDDAQVHFKFFYPNKFVWRITAV